MENSLFFTPPPLAGCKNKHTTIMKYLLTCNKILNKMSIQVYKAKKEKRKCNIILYFSSSPYLAISLLLSSLFLSPTIEQFLIRRVELI